MKKENTHVVCIVGEACSGKTHIARIINKSGKRIVVSRTTRSCRYNIGERPGEQLSYHYLKKEDFHSDKEKGIVIANTVYGDNYYWTVIEDVVVGGTIYYIIDPAGVKAMRELVEKYNSTHEDSISMTVVSVYACRSVRLARALRDFKNHEEAEARIARDDEYMEMFAETRKEADIVIDNNGDDQNLLEQAVFEKLINNNVF